jgi:CheY-like chemotaxis protein
VLAASTRDVALQLINDPDHIAVVVTDFHMPGADSIELARGARQRHPGIPVVFTTGRPDLLAEHQGELPYLCLPKPFAMLQLVGGRAGIATSRLML